MAVSIITVTELKEPTILVLDKGVVKMPAVEGPHEAIFELRELIKQLQQRVFNLESRVKDLENKHDSDCPCNDCYQANNCF